MKTTTAITSTKASDAQLRARQERRRSNAAGTHANRGNRRARSRSAAKARAIREAM